MSENLQTVQYPKRTLKITLEQFKDKEYNTHYFMLHMTILILPLGNIWLLMKKVTAFVVK